MRQQDQPESFDTDLGVPVPNVPEMPSTRLVQNEIIISIYF